MTNRRKITRVLSPGSCGVLLALALGMLAAGCTGLGSPTQIDTLDASLGDGSSPNCQSGTSFYADEDGDGFGDPDVTMQACGSVDGFVEQAGDCDDRCPTCHMGAVEECDGLENDCDGVVDNLDSQVCGSQIGECQEGIRSCIDGAFSTHRPSYSRRSACR